MGRNCRFLQGPGTDPAEVARLSAALKASPPEPITVTLLNYTKDGRPFWNCLHVAAVRDADGAVEFFIGVQLDVTMVAGAAETTSDAVLPVEGGLGGVHGMREQKVGCLEVGKGRGLLGIGEDWVRWQGAATANSHAVLPVEGGLGGVYVTDVKNLGCLEAGKGRCLLCVGHGWLKT